MRICKMRTTYGRTPVWKMVRMVDGRAGGGRNKDTQTNISGFWRSLAKIVISNNKTHVAMRVNGYYKQQFRHGSRYKSILVLIIF